MTPEQFTYWLQGYFEIAKPLELSSYETKIIQNHLSLVFTKVTPSAYQAGYTPLTTTHTGIPQQPLC